MCNYKPNKTDYEVCSLTGHYDYPNPSHIHPSEPNRFSCFCGYICVDTYSKFQALQTIEKIR